ncbi:MAG: DUF2752 domain-containing protein [candidate division WS1 bacterium]|jgi:hypothetical protein|nr:DUF2752 domain-containing protein [candidate division WS1 bacterium]
MEQAQQSVAGRRIEAAALLLLSVAVLVLARLLEPSTNGHGTHEAVMLLPCGFRWLTGLPCPACGLTTAFTLMARGDVAGAVAAHLLGPVLYAATWMLGAGAAVALLRGTPALPATVMRPRAARILLIAFGVAWAVNLLRHFAG